MESRPQNPRAASAERTRIAVVGGGRRCLSLLEVFASRAGANVDIAGVADIDPEAAGISRARDQGVFTTTDYTLLLDLEYLDLVINLTGDRALCEQLSRRVRRGVAVMSYPASCVFQEVLENIHGVTNRLAEQSHAISRLRSFARAIEKATVVGVMILDPDYRVKWINDAAVKSSGISREDALASYCFQVSHRRDRPCAVPDAPCPFRETLETGQSAHGIHEHVLHDGKAAYCDVSTFPLLDNDGRVIEVVEFIRDVTEDLNDKVERRTRAMKDDLVRMVQEDKLVALGKLVASVAHEINNPIGSIINLARLVQVSLEEGAPTDEHGPDMIRQLDLAVGEAKRCGRIVNNLLSFARQQPVEPREIDLVEVVGRIYALTGHGMDLAGIRFDNLLEGRSLEVWGDHNQIQQCLTNLFFNAMEAMPDGGRLTVAGGRTEDGAGVWLEVSDTGVGIAEEHMPYIFEPFFTTKPESHGVGLGLAMVYGIVREHGGEITAKSEPGRGATLRMVLPAPPDKEDR
ncbi:MAG: ATP-binding protein [Desulfatibacillaceae bacterium]